MFVCYLLCCVRLLFVWYLFVLYICICLFGIYLWPFGAHRVHTFRNCTVKGTCTVVGVLRRHSYGPLHFESGLPHCHNIDITIVSGVTRRHPHPSNVCLAPKAGFEIVLAGATADRPSRPPRSSRGRT